MQTATIEQELLDLKDQALEATRKRDTAFYREYLTDDAIAVVPAGIFTRDQIVGAMGQGTFQSSAIDDERAVPLGTDAGMVTYVATFGEGGEARRAFVTTVYRRLDGAWRGVFYQQTPLART
jgi:hypothetical protein